jgi:hypothetical protein
MSEQLLTAVQIADRWGCTRTAVYRRLGDSDGTRNAPRGGIEALFRLSRVEAWERETTTVTHDPDTSISVADLSARWGVSGPAIQKRIGRVHHMHNGKGYYLLDTVTAWEAHDESKRQGAAVHMQEVARQRAVRRIDTPPGHVSAAEAIELLGCCTSSLYRILGKADAYASGRAYYRRARVEEARDRPRKQGGSPAGSSVTAAAPPREELIALREAGCDREAIATRYQVTLSRVKRWVRDLAIPSPRELKPPPEKEPEEPSHGVLLDPEEGIPLMERCKARLGPRMSECRRTGRYTLDGQRVRVADVVAAAGLAIAEPPERSLSSRVGDLHIIPADEPLYIGRNWTFADGIA